MDEVGCARGLTKLHNMKILVHEWNDNGFAISCEYLIAALIEDSTTYRDILTCRHIHPVKNLCIWVRCSNRRR